MYHIGKCLWTFVKFRSFLAADKVMSADEALETSRTDAEIKYGH